MIAHQQPNSSSHSAPHSPQLSSLRAISLSAGDYEVFKQLCFHNGIAVAATAHKSLPVSSHSTTSQMASTAMRSLQMFPHLTQLLIVGQDIDCIQGLDGCPLLEQLSICECLLTRIEGLDRLVNLKQLHLYANQITRIEGLSKLKRLERLWLFDNEISSIENMEGCVELRDLNLAHNQIATIRSEAFQPLTKLETLNLSGNRGLARLSDILALRSLRSLRTLRFQDPSFHAAPLSELENYQTYCIYHLPFLHQLDALQISSAIRTSVQTALIKKNMYYSMRSETIRYNRQMISAIIDRVFNERIQRMLDEVQQRITGKEQSDELKICLRKACYWDSIRYRLGRLINSYAEARQKMLHAELHSCGFQNFHAEKIGDINAEIDWSADSSADNLHGISYRVNANRETADERYTLIFSYGSDVNEAFEAIESCVNVHRDNQVYKSDSLQLVIKVMSANPTVCVGLVMFCICQSSWTKFMTRFLFGAGDIGEENAFHRFEQAFQEEFAKFDDEKLAGELKNAAADFDRQGLIAVDTENSITTSDLSWMKLETAKAVQTSSKLTRINLSHNSITSIDTSLLYLPGLQELDLSFNRIKIIQRFNCNDSSNETLSQLRSLNLLGNLLEKAADIEPIFYLKELKELDIRFNPLAAHSLRLEESLDKLEKFNGNSMSARKRVAAKGRPLIFDVKRALLAWNADSPESNERCMNLSSSWIDDLPILSSGFQAITELNLSNNQLISTCALSGMINLRWLNLAFNMIELMDFTFDRLRYLNLSGNLISQVDLSGIPNLLELYLTGNNIKTLANVHPTKKAEKLVILNLQNNPVTELEGYRSYILFICTKLQYLDSIFVTNAARQEAQETFSGMFTFEFLLDVFPETHLHLLEEIRLAHMQISNITCFNRCHYFEQLVSIDLSNNFLKEFNALLYLPALKCLSLESNRLQTLFTLPVDGYEWPALEQLYLGFNMISNIQSIRLEKFPNLRILSLNGNTIQQLNGLPVMKKLTKLAIEANQIRVVDDKFFSQLPNLEGLYLENNRLRNLTFWSHPNLKTLDICNNRLNDIMEIKKLDFPALQTISIRGNVMNRDKWHRYYLVLQFGKISEINGELVSENEKIRSEAYRFKFQNEDQAISMSMDAQSMLDHEVLASAAQTPPIVKIKSLTLNLG